MTARRPRTLPPGHFLGRCLRHRRVGSIALTESAYEDGQALHAHSHATVNLFVVVAGTLTETVGRRSAVHRPSAAVFNPAGLEHSTVSHGRATRVLNLQIDEGWLEPIRRQLALEDPASAAPAGLAPRLLHEFRSRAPFSDLAIEGLVVELLAAIGRASCRSERTAPAWLARAERLLRDRLPDCPTLSQLALELGVERTRLARGFRRHLGRSVGEASRLLRLELAQELLADPRRSLASIASECGFSDQSHFTRLFRAHSGATPGEFRRALLQRHGDTSRPRRF